MAVKFVFDFKKICARKNKLHGLRKTNFHISFMVSKDEWNVVLKFISQYMYDDNWLKNVAASWYILASWWNWYWEPCKDPVPNDLLPRLVYRFVCAGCNANYISETNRHFSTRVREHLATDQASPIFKHLNSNHRCKSMASSQCFEIIDYAETPFLLKIKEALHILWDKPVLNQQVEHVNLELFLWTLQ